MNCRRRATPAAPSGRHFTRRPWLPRSGIPSRAVCLRMLSGMGSRGRRTLGIAVPNMELVDGAERIKNARGSCRFSLALSALMCLTTDIKCFYVESGFHDTRLCPQPDRRELSAETVAVCLPGVWGASRVAQATIPTWPTADRLASARCGCDTAQVRQLQLRDSRIARLTMECTPRASNMDWTHCCADRGGKF